ncbi:MAG: AmpG family muropeptide MFS transporter [bacterium]|nr:AmpG family muropeptide MFS transporter [bacterium]
MEPAAFNLLRTVLELMSVYADRRIWIMGLLGFASGLPLLLTSSTLAFRLDALGVTYTKIGLFSIATLPYALKFLWAPLVDRLPIPFLSNWLGRRRSWLLLSQVALVGALAALALVNPAENLMFTALLLFFVAFSAAIQEIVMLAYQAERLGRSQFGAGEAMTVFGYRMGMLVAGAGALYLSTFLSWSEIYLFMAILGAIGITTTLSITEPNVPVGEEIRLREKRIKEYLQSHPKLGARSALFFSWVHAAIISPFVDFMKNPGWYVVIGIMLFYKLGDNLIGSMSNLFYVDLGFTPAEIASASKVFGMWATILGGFLGGMFINRLGMMKSLFIFGLFHGISNLMYIILAKSGGGIALLYTSIALENVTGGMRTTALFAFQFTLCNVSYAATQLALMTSCVHFGRTMFSSLSGWLVDTLGWVDFFYLATSATIPSLMLVVWLSRIMGERFFPGKRIPFLAASSVGKGDGALSLSSEKPEEKPPEDEEVKKYG